MSVIGTITTWLKVKSGAFDKGVDKSRKKLSFFQKQAKSMRNTMLAGLGFAVALRSMQRFFSSSAKLFLRQEDAVNSLRASLALLGQDSDAAIADMKGFASGIQAMTRFGDEAVLEIAAMGSSMGKLSGQILKDATVAAIGLSKAYGIELAGAMRLVARASVGDTATLKRYGITLDATLGPQEKFNELLRIGAKNFSLAQREAETYAGSLTTIGNAWGDMKEGVGAFLAEKSGQFLADFTDIAEAIGRNRAIAEFGTEVDGWARAVSTFNAANFELGEENLTLARRVALLKELEASYQAMHSRAKAGAFARVELARKELKPLEEQLAAQNKLNADRDRLRSFAEETFRNTRTEAEKYEQQIRKLNEALAAGVLGQDAHTRAVNKAFAAVGPVAGGRINMGGIQQAIMQAGVIGANVAKEIVQEVGKYQYQSPGAVEAGSRFTGAASGYRSRMEKIQQEQIQLDKSRNTTLSAIERKIGGGTSTVEIA